MKLLIRIKLF